MSSVSSLTHSSNCPAYFWYALGLGMMLCWKVRVSVLDCVAQWRTGVGSVDIPDAGDVKAAVNVM